MSKVNEVRLSHIVEAAREAVSFSGESEALEFKSTTGARREAAMTVCAFLNQEGGQVLFGVTPAGVVVGQQVSEHTIEELSAEIRRIAPPAFPTIERVSVDGGREVIMLTAKIDDDGGAVTVRFRRGQFVPLPTPGGISEPEALREMILALLDRTRDGLTRRELHARLGPGVTERQVRRTLKELRDRELIISTNRGPLTRWKQRTRQGRDGSPIGS